MTADIRWLRDQVKGILEGVEGLAVGVNKVPDGVKINGQVAAPYAVIYNSPGRNDGDRYCDTPNRFVWSFQVTVASGDADATDYFLVQVRDALTGARIEPGNRAAGKLEETTDPGPSRRDDDNLADVRYWAPLFYKHTTTKE